MTTCPFCSEEIQSTAVKCKHCGSALLSAAWTAFYRRYATMTPFERTRAWESMSQAQREILQSIVDTELLRTSPPGVSATSDAGGRNPAVVVTLGCLGLLVLLFVLGVLASLFETNSEESPAPSRTMTEKSPVRANAKANETFTAPPVLRTGLSYDDVMTNLTTFFPMSKSTPVDGRTRYMGQSQGGALEIIGDDRNDIDAATLLVGFPSDNNSVIIENTALLLRFIKNADPSWSGGARWMNGAIERLSAGEESVDVIRGERRISMQMVKEFGLVIVTVKHRLAD